MRFDRRPLVLLVDNHADNREMYALYLRLRGFCVIACADSRVLTKSRTSAESASVPW